MASLLESFLFFLLYAFIYLTYFYYTFIIHTRKHRLEIVYETKIIVIETAKWKLEFLDLSNSYIRSIYFSHKFDDISFESKKILGFIGSIILPIIRDYQKRSIIFLLQKFYLFEYKCVRFHLTLGFLFLY